MLTEEDLVYIFCIMKKIRINWIHIIKEHMQKAMRLSDYHYPYAVLISKFLLYFEVNLEDETSELVKSTQELNNGSLSKMGFTKVGGKWISKDGDFGASSSAVADHEQDEHVADMDFQHEDLPEAHQDADLVLVLEIKKKECKPCLLLRDSWLIGLIALRRINGISIIYVTAISRGLIIGLTTWMHVS